MQRTRNECVAFSFLGLVSLGLVSLGFASLLRRRCLRPLDIRGDGYSAMRAPVSA